MTCKIVKAPTDIPRIMEIPRCLAYSLRIKGWATFLQIQQRLQRAGIADPKFYGINCRAKLGAKLLDRFFHRRRQVSPL
jgi:hypothetical protein